MGSCLAGLVASKGNQRLGEFGFTHLGDGDLQLTDHVSSRDRQAVVEGSWREPARETPRSWMGEIMESLVADPGKRKSRKASEEKQLRIEGRNASIGSKDDIA